MILPQPYVPSQWEPSPAIVIRITIRLAALPYEFLAGVRKLIGYWERWPWSLAEEANEPFDILRSRCQEELLAKNFNLRKRKRRSPI